jgi:hypothetical protein
VLVDRIWPRGISKRNAALDEWLRVLASRLPPDAGSHPCKKQAAELWARLGS